jgi:hypothetical protein
MALENNEEFQELEDLEGTGPEAPPEEQPGETVAEDVEEAAVAPTPGGAIVELNAEEFPQLAQLQPGDTFNLTLQDVGEDGIYRLVPTGEAEAPGGTAETGGRAQVIEELIGPGE